MADIRYCTRCKFMGRHPIDTEISGGQWAALVALTLCFVLPGVIYAIHLATGGGSRRFYVCPKCGGRRVSAPLDSPVAQMEMESAQQSGFCIRCGKHSELGAQFCPSCGAPMGAQAARAAIAAAPKSLSYSLGQLFRNKWAVAIAAILLFSVIIRIATQDTSQQSATPTPITTIKSAAASGALAGSIVETPEEQPVSPQEARAARKAYAASFDQAMLDLGVESTTRTAGPQDTTFKITYALTGRVMANAVSKRLDWDELRKLGFRKVILTSGFEDEMNETYSWNVD